MKKIVIALGSFTVLTGCASSPAPASPPSAAPTSAAASPSDGDPKVITPQIREQRAATTLQRIEAHEFAGSREWFDDTMHAQFGVDAIRDVWTRTESELGAFSSQSFSGATRVPGHIALDYDLTFQKRHLKGRVVFDEAGRIAGLFLQPIE